MYPLSKSGVLVGRPCHQQHNSPWYISSSSYSLFYCALLSPILHPFLSSSSRTRLAIILHSSRTHLFSYSSRTHFAFISHSSCTFRKLKVEKCLCSRQICGSRVGAGEPAGVSSWVGIKQVGATKIFEKKTITGKKEKYKINSIQPSRVVPHRSTTWTRSCLKERSGNGENLARL